MRVLSELPPQDWLNPEPLLREMKVPLRITHGRDDSVIPYTQAEDLSQLLPPALKHKPALTGFYHHTGLSSGFSLLKNIFLLPSELMSSLRLLYGLLQVAGVASLQQPSLDQEAE